MLDRKTYSAVALAATFYLFLPLAIVFNFIPFEYRFLVLTVATILLLFTKPDSKTTLSDLGIKKSGSVVSIVTVLPTTLALLGGVLLLSQMIDIDRIDNSNLTISFYLFYIFISCPLQEFAYRGHLSRLMLVLKLSKRMRVLFGALLYSFMHIIYNDELLIILTLCLGVFWSLHYEKFKNLAGVTVSHALLGAAAILSGLV